MKIINPKDFTSKDYKSSYIYIYQSGNSFYKLHKRNENFSFVDLNSTECHANGINHKSPEDTIKKVSSSATIYEFENFREFMRWVVNNV